MKSNWVFVLLKVSREAVDPTVDKSSKDLKQVCDVCIAITHCI